MVNPFAGVLNDARSEDVTLHGVYLEGEKVLPKIPMTFC